MRILCLTSRLPYPPDRGDRLRAFHIIEHLAQEHELTLISFIADKSEREQIEPLRTYCRRIHTLLHPPHRSAATVGLNIWRRDPLQTLYYRSRAMQRLVDETLAQTPFQLAYVHLFRMAQYVTRHTGLYRVVDLTDVISREIAHSLPYRTALSRLVYTVERPRIERYERWVAQTFEETWLISEADRQALLPACPAANIRVIPNGVDTETFRPLGHPPEQNSIIFVGHMRVFHNIDAAVHLAEEILPRVRQQMADCTLYLTGADPSPRVQHLGRLDGVRVTGFVPDLNEHLNRAAVFVAPLRFAAGVQNKVLEAMAAGRPVVTTPIVNAGLGAEPGRDLLVARGPEETARQIITLLQDRPLRERIGRAARRFVRQHYSWEHAAARVRDIAS